VNITLQKNIFLALGLLAAVWFFVGYPSQDPRSLLDMTHADVSEIETKAKKQVESFGYDAAQFRMESHFYSNAQLLKSLQKQLGRDQLISRYKKRDYPNTLLFYWEVQFIPREEIKESFRDTEDDRENPLRNEEITLHFSQSGEFMELDHGDLLPIAKKVDRQALSAAFGGLQDTVATILSAYSDSILTQRLVTDIKQDDDVSTWEDSSKFNHLDYALKGRHPFQLSRHDIFDMAMYHLQNTGWDTRELVKDTVLLGRVNGSNTVSAKFQSVDFTFGQKLSVDVQLTESGSLVNISSDYESRQDIGNGDSGIWSTLEDVLIFLFILGVVILFFYRIRVRAVDTKSALVVSILLGLGVSALVGLYLWQAADIFSSPTDWDQKMEFLISTGFAGAGASLAFFILFAVGDSLTRQHWPQKLKIYNYLRQGMIFNRPVGFMLVRSVILAFFFAGIWTLLLWAFPQFYLEFDGHVFMAQQAAGPPLFMLISNGLFSLGMVLAIFLVLGSQLMGQTKSKIITSVLIVFACGVFPPFMGQAGPSGYEFLVGLVLGLTLVTVYLQWDFLTLFFSHFLFLCLMSTTTGWIIPGSLDQYIFVMVLVVMALFLVVGFIAIGRGEEETKLSGYVPQYVEELAQEERIKQELEIAREVQQSFLPIRTPEFKNLDLAAVCKPAYETGGDYYDFVQLDDHRVAVMIGDVSGKGIQAAFYMTFVKGVIHSLCRETNSPAEVLKKTNRLFCDNAPRGIFISLVYGILDLKNKTFVFARAGHNPILKIPAANGSLEQLQPRGIGIGLTKGTAFDKEIEEIKISLSDEDLLVLYTDGIVEALNEQQTFYGTHRLNNVLKRNKQQPAKQILELLTRDVESFVGKAKQHDDMTMLVMKMRKAIDQN